MSNIVVSDQTLVAQRVYTFHGTDVLTSRIGLPSQQDVWFQCDVQIIEFATDSIFAMGIDAIDALDLALSMADTAVQRISETKYNGELKWIGSGAKPSIGLPSIPLSHSSVESFRPY